MLSTDKVERNIDISIDIIDKTRIRQITILNTRNEKYYKHYKI